MDGKTAEMVATVVLSLVVIGIMARHVLTIVAHWASNEGR